MHAGVGLDALALAREAIDRCRYEIDEMPRASLPILAGVMTDKALLLTGGATVRIEHVTGPTHAGLNEMLDSLGVIEVQATAPAPVEARETSAQKGADLAAGGRIEAAAGIEFGASGDLESPIIRPCQDGAEQARADGGRMPGADAEVRPGARALATARARPPARARPTAAAREGGRGGCPISTGGV